MSRSHEVTVGQDNEITIAIKKRLSLLNDFEKIFGCEEDTNARNQYQAFLSKRKTELLKTLDDHREGPQLINALDKFEDDFYAAVLQIYKFIEDTKNLKIKEREKANEAADQARVLKENKANENIANHTRKVKELEERAKSRPPEERTEQKPRRRKKDKTKPSKAAFIDDKIELKRAVNDPPIDRELNHPARLVLHYDDNDLSKSSNIKVYWFDEKGDRANKTINIENYLREEAKCEISVVNTEPGQNSLAPGQICIFETKINSGEEITATKVSWWDGKKIQTKLIEDHPGSIQELRLKKEKIIPENGLDIGVILKFITSEVDPDEKTPVLLPGQISKYETKIAIKKDAEIAYWIDENGELQTKVLRRDLESREDDLDPIIKSASLRMQNEKFAELKLLLKDFRETYKDLTKTSSEHPLIKIIQKACKNELADRGHLTHFKKDTTIDNVIKSIAEVVGTPVEKRETIRNTIIKTSESIHDENKIISSTIDEALNKEDISEILKNDLLQDQININSKKIVNYENQIKSITIPEKEKLKKSLDDIKNLHHLFDGDTDNQEYIDKLVDDNYTIFFEAYQEQLRPLKQGPITGGMLSSIISKLTKENPQEIERKKKNYNSTLIKEHIHYTFNNISEKTPGDKDDQKTLYLSSEKIRGFEKLTIYYYSVFDKKFVSVPLNLFQTNVIQNKISIERKINKDYELNQLIPLITKICRLTPESKCNYNETKNKIIIEKFVNLDTDIKETSERQETINKFNEIYDNNTNKIIAINKFIQTNNQVLDQKKTYYLKLTDTFESRTMRKAILDSNFSSIVVELTKLNDLNIKLKLDRENGDISSQDALQKSLQIEEEIIALNKNAEKLLNDYDINIRIYEEICDTEIKKREEEILLIKEDDKQLGVNEIFSRNEKNLIEIEQLYTTISNEKILHDLLSNHPAARDRIIENKSQIDSPFDQQFELKKVELQKTKAENVKLHNNLTVETIPLTGGNEENDPSSLSQTKLDIFEALKMRKPNFKMLTRLNETIDELKTYKDKSFYKRTEVKPLLSDYLLKLQAINKTNKFQVLFDYSKKLDTLNIKFEKFIEETKLMLSDNSHNILFSEKNDNVRLDEEMIKFHQSHHEIKKMIMLVNEQIPLDTITIDNFETIKEFCDTQLPILSDLQSKLTTIHNYILQTNLIETISEALEKIKKAGEVILSFINKDDSVFDATDRGTISRIKAQLEKAKLILDSNSNLSDDLFKELKSNVGIITKIEMRLSTRAKELREEIIKTKQDKIAEAENKIDQIIKDKEALYQSIEDAKKEYSKFDFSFDKYINDINDYIAKINQKLFLFKDNTNEKLLNDLVLIDDLLNTDIPKLNTPIAELKKYLDRTLQIAIVDSMIQKLKELEFENITNTTYLTAINDKPYLDFLRSNNVDLNAKAEIITKEIETTYEDLKTIKNNLQNTEASHTEATNTEETRAEATLETNLSQNSKPFQDYSERIGSIQDQILAVANDHIDIIKKYKQSRIDEATKQLLGLEKNEVFDRLQNKSLNPTYLGSFTKKNKGVDPQNAVDGIKSKISEHTQTIEATQSTLKESNTRTLTDIQNIEIIISESIPALIGQISNLLKIEINIAQTETVEALLKDLENHKKVLTDLDPILNNTGYLAYLTRINAKIKEDNNKIVTEIEETKKFLENNLQILNDTDNLQIIDNFDIFEVDNRNNINGINNKIVALETNHKNYLTDYKISKIDEAKNLVAKTSIKALEIKQAFNTSEQTSADMKYYLDSFYKKNGNITLEDENNKINSAIANINERIITTHNTILKLPTNGFDDISGIENIISTEIPGLDKYIERILQIQKNVVQSHMVETAIASLIAYKADIEKLQALLLYDNGEYRKYLNATSNDKLVIDADNLSQDIDRLKTQFIAAGESLNSSIDQLVRPLSEEQWNELSKLQNEIDTIKSSISKLQTDQNKTRLAYDISQAYKKMSANITKKLSALNLLIDSSLRTIQDKSGYSTKPFNEIINNASDFIKEYALEFKFLKRDFSDQEDPIKAIKDFENDLENQINKLQQSIVIENRHIYTKYLQDKHTFANQFYDGINNQNRALRSLKIDPEKLKKLRQTSDLLNDDEIILDYFENKIKEHDSWKYFIDVNGLPTDELINLENTVTNLTITSNRISYLQKIYNYKNNEIFPHSSSENKYLINKLNDSLKRELIHHFLDIFSPYEDLETQFTTFEEGKGNKYREIEESYSFLYMIFKNIRSIEKEYKFSIQGITNVLEKIELSSSEKIDSITQILLKTYWHLRNDEGLFSNPIADKLHPIITSPKFLDVPYKFGCQVSKNVYGNAPNIKEIKKFQREGFQSDIPFWHGSYMPNFKFYNNGVSQNFIQYVTKSNFKFCDGDNFTDFQNPINDLGRKNQARARIIIHDYIRRQLNAENHGEVYQLDTKFHKKLISPMQMDEDKKEFPFTCAYQRLIIALSKSHLNTHRRSTIIVPLMKWIETMRLDSNPADELSKVKSLRIMIDAANRAIRDTLEETTLGQVLNFFGLREHTNLGDVLERFSNELKNEIKELEQLKKEQLVKIKENEDKIAKKSEEKKDAFFKRLQEDVSDKNLPVTSDQNPLHIQGQEEEPINKNQI